ncbi:MAG: exonuclease domain-containing protein [Bacteroidota bacterium]|nr:exonuclease domain-containing protein [Bacteroidota bacterium]
MYAIIDIETTGGNAVYERITEIAIFVYDGENVVDQFTSLINPERPIPFYITKLTGISDQMVKNAPTFEQLAARIDQITTGCFFVAHNVSFDYNFVREEFRRIGFKYERKTLCTVKLSRRLIPGKRSYSLGNLCHDIGINIKDRHRAEGDALATVKLFELLLAADPSLSKQATQKLPNNMPQHLLERLPESTGVYYFYDEDDKLIYIGKSINIRERVLSHLYSRTGKKAGEMKKKIHNIDFELTGSDLIAQLKESDEIKQIKPLFNGAQRKTISTYEIATDIDENGYQWLRVMKNPAGATALASYNSRAIALQELDALTEKYFLCRKINGLYKSAGACIQQGMGYCLGACVGKEEPESYNRRTMEAVRQFEYLHRNMVIVDKGRTMNEKSVIVVENGRYLGYGYLDTSCFGGSLDELKECIKQQEDNRVAQKIINSYLLKKGVEKVIKF